jgi:propionyl-CoA synthetase
MRYEDFHRRSIEEPEAFWAEQAQAIHWRVAPKKILDYSSPPFRKWFAGGETNLCHNAVDRHLDARGDQLALVVISTETDTTREITYRELHCEVNVCAAVLKSLGVVRGDRVVIYMPNMAEAVFAMLACARIGAVHSVVFGGFAARNLALRIDDAEPKLLICADAGIRGGKVIPYKPLVDAACAEAVSPPQHVLIVSRGLDPGYPVVEGRDVDYATLRAEHEGANVDVAWLESNEPSYLLYTSGTTGKPKGVQRDVGGYAVAMGLSVGGIWEGWEGRVGLCGGGGGGGVGGVGGGGGGVGGGGWG